MWSSHCSVQHWAGSLVRNVLLIQCVRCTTEFQVVEMYQFPLPGVIDSLDMIGQFANPSHHNVRTLPWVVELGHEGILSLDHQPQFCSPAIRW